MCVAVVPEGFWVVQKSEIMCSQNGLPQCWICFQHVSLGCIVRRFWCRILLDIYCFCAPGFRQLAGWLFHSVAWNPEAKWSSPASSCRSQTDHSLITVSKIVFPQNKISHILPQFVSRLVSLVQADLDSKVSALRSRCGKDTHVKDFYWDCHVRYFCVLHDLISVFNSLNKTFDFWQHFLQGISSLTGPQPRWPFPEAAVLARDGFEVSRRETEWLQNTLTEALLAFALRQHLFLDPLTRESGGSWCKQSWTHWHIGHGCANRSCEFAFDSNIGTSFAMTVTWQLTAEPKGPTGLTDGATTKAAPVTSIWLDVKPANDKKDVLCLGFTLAVVYCLYQTNKK